MAMRERHDQPGGAVCLNAVGRLWWDDRSGNPMIRTSAPDPGGPPIGSLQLGEGPIRVAEAFHGDPHPIHQGEIQAAGATSLGAPAGIVEDTTGAQIPAAPAGEQDRHLIGRVPVADEQVRAAHQQRVVEQGAIPSALRER